MILLGDFMKKKILFMIFLFIMCINVKALVCEYKVDKNNMGIVITVNEIDESPSVQLSGGYYLSAGTVNNVGTIADMNSKSNCPEKIFYVCNASRFCKLNTYFFQDNNATLNGYVDFKGHGSESSGDATVSSVINNFRDGNGCGAMKGLSDLIEKYIKMPLLVVALVLFLVMTTIEYSKVVFSEDGSSKKANERTLKRALSMVLLGLSPFVIQLLLKVVEIPMSC
jgi:hypothetical protein